MRNLIPDYVKKLPVRRPSGPAVPGEIRLDWVVEAVREAAAHMNRHRGCTTNSILF